MSSALETKILEPDTGSTHTGGEKTVFAIGDVHGHLLRFVRLLEQEGLIGPCPGCDGMGRVDIVEPSGEVIECPECEGTCMVRARHDVEIIMLGDVGHFGYGGSPTGDMITYEYAERFADLILWGNHDRAVFSPRHIFSGYERPRPETANKMVELQKKGKMALAADRHGYLLTHAGLHAAFKYNKVEDRLKSDPNAFAEWINGISDPLADVDEGEFDKVGVVDSVYHRRGGSSQAGGILWRDFEEKLYDGFRQVFGHSASREHKVRRSKTGYGICIDIGGKKEAGADNCLAGIYLPSEKVVRVDL